MLCRCSLNNESESMWKEEVVAKFKVLSRHLPTEIEGKPQKPQGFQFPGRDLNLGPTEYEAEVLTTRARRLFNGVSRIL